MDSIAAGELPQADGISWKYKNSIEFPKTDHELSGHGRWPINFLVSSSDLKQRFFFWPLRVTELTVEMVQ
jgi:hypothetical protein